jgi:hypothetical protein
MSTGGLLNTAEKHRAARGPHDCLVEVAVMTSSPDWPVVGGSRTV